MVTSDLIQVLDLLKRAEALDIKLSFENDELKVMANKGKKPDPLFLKELKENKPHLVEYFRTHVRKQGANGTLSVITPRGHKGQAPLSFAQERLWFINRMQGGSSYNLPWIFRLTGTLDTEALEHAFKGIVARHEILRTVILEEQGTGSQLIQEAGGWKMNRITSEEISATGIDMQDYITNLLYGSFDLSTDPMLKVTLIRLSETEHIVAAVVHHIAFDGWSMSILVTELAELYASYIGNRPAVLPQLPVQYADYAICQREFLSGEKLAGKLSYWKRQLTGVAPLELVTDRPRPAQRSGHGNIVQKHLSKEHRSRLLKLAQQEGVTLFMLMLAAFKALLHRHSGQADICVGMPIAGRQQKEVEDLIGFFVNTLPLRSMVNGEASFRDFLQQVKQMTLDAYEHQDTPFEKIVEALGTERDMSRNPVFQVLFSMQNILRSTELDLGGVQLTTESSQRVTSQFDLNINITESAEGLFISLVYCSDLYEPATMERMLSHYVLLLDSVLEDIHRPVGKLQLIPAQEQKQLLEFGKAAGTPVSAGSVMELFEQQALQTPDAVALVFAGEELSYRELDERSNQLAHYLHRTGVQPEEIIPVCLHRSAEMMIALLGILKAGCAFLPISPGQPEERIAYLVEDSRARLILASEETEHLLPYGVPSILLDRHWTVISTSPADKLNQNIAPEQLAYIIYTSGSTGTPKGVMIEHRSLLNYLVNSRELYAGKDTEGSGSYAFLSFSFDASLTALFVPLLMGRTLVLSSASALEVFEDETLQRYAPYDFLKLTPAHLALLQTAIEDSNGNLLTQRLVVGGEALHTHHFQYLIDKGLSLEIINEYGPTETTVGCSIFRFSTMDKIEQRETGVLIGRPMSNVELYVLEPGGHPAPIGVPGELCIGGVQVARGYLNLPELSEAKFIPHPFSTTPGARLYRSGDRVRWLQDGNLEYLGRTDEQVKIRGYRIEPGEIEQVLQQASGVRQAAVAVQESEGGDRKLIGFVVMEEELDQQAILSFVGSRLPEYMVPSALVQVDAVPLTAHGKVDRKLLLKEFVLPQQARAYEAPRNEVEEKLALIWEELLEIDQIGINDNFFALGGHSLMAIRVLAAIRTVLGREITINDVFEYPTIALLAAHMAGEQTGTLLPAIQRQEQQERMPLSYGQERLWFIDKLQGSVDYHMPWVFRLTGDLDIESLENSFRDILRRHDVLRTIIREENGIGYQVVTDADDWRMQFHDEASIPAQYAGVQDYIDGFIKQPFNLSSDIPLRVALIRLSAGEHVLAAVIHHIGFDGWSIGIMVHELVELYRSRRESRPAVLNELPVRYADYAAWQRQYLQGEVLDSKIAYWKKQLGGVEPLALMTDHPRQAERSIKGGLVSRIVGKEAAGRLNAFSQREGATLFMTLLAAFKVLLYRYTSQQDICVGTPIAGRRQQETEGLIGFFVNTLALRSTVSGDQSFAALMREVKKMTLEAYEHQDAPFEKIVEAIAVERDMSRSPVFQVMFTVQNMPESRTLDLGGVQLTEESPGEITSQFDLSLDVSEINEGLLLLLTYSSELYEEETMQRLLEHYENLVSSILADADTPVSGLRMMLPAEEEAQATLFNKTHSPYPSHQTVIDLLEDQAAKTPGSIALVFEHEQLSYRELDDRSSRLAAFLSSKGINREEPVAVCMDRSAELVIAILAVMKTGAAVVPIDPSYPQDRIDYMISDSGCKLVIDEELLNDFASKAGEYSSENLTPFRLTPSHLAYIIYTSGSTGKPKGVQVEHRSLVNLLSSMSRRLQVPADMSLLSVTTFCFDIFYMDLFLPLLAGGRLVLASRETVQDGYALKKELARHRPTLMQAVPSLWQSLLDCGWRNEEQVIILTGGEAVRESLKDALTSLGGQKVWNFYGPTETTIYATGGELRKNEKVTIGKPLHNLKAYILDAYGNLVPAGVSGELCIGGDGVARGYLNRPQLNLEKFITPAHPLFRGDRLYRTGDLARWLPDGSIEFLGRMDDQVKVRGYRIELGEIENVLQQAPGIRQAVVVARDDRQQNKILIAFAVVEESFDREAALSFLRTQLPDYMVPGILAEVDEMPLTHSGKVNRKELLRSFVLPQQVEAYEAPRNAVEAALAEIWQELLGVEKIGVHENFFSLGGHSLMAIRLISGIRNRLEREMGIREVFDHPTIGQMALQLEQKGRAELMPALQKSEHPQYIPLSFSQERMWFIDRLQGTVQYHLPWVFRLSGSLDVAAVEDSLRTIVQRHEVLRTVIREHDGIGHQVVTPAEEWKMSFLEKEETASLEEYVMGLLQKPFNLAQDPMLKLALVRLSPQEHLLVAVAHHIAFDGWSIGILVGELVELYKSRKENRTAFLKELPVQYADYAIWQRQYLSDETLDRKLSYWKEKLRGVQPLELVTDYPRPAVQAISGDTINKTISADVYKQLALLSRKEGVTLYMTLLAALKLLLSRYTGQRDICVGTPVAGRHRREVEGLIGFFVNTLALRTKVDAELKFNEFLQEVRQTTLEAFEHQDTPFEKIVEALGVERDMSRNLIFQLMFILQNAPASGQLHLGDVVLEEESFRSATSSFDLSLNIMEGPDGLQLTLIYCSALFRRDTAERLLDHYCQLLENITLSAGTQLGGLEILHSSERKQLLYEFNDNAVEFPAGKTLVDLLEEQVEKTPDAIALVFEEQALSFRQLNEKANRLAWYLRSRGVEEEALTGICLDRSPEMIIGIVAVLKAGGAFIPIDPNYPGSRIAYMLEDSSCTHVITTSALAPLVQGAGRAEVIPLDDMEAVLAVQASENLVPSYRTPSGLAYVIYTSGSTGKPKGVMIEHRSIANTIQAKQSRIGVQQGERCLQFAPISFDASVYEIFIALCNGASLHIASEDLRKDPRLLEEYIAEHGIDMLTLPPAFLKIVEPEKLRPLKRLLTGGEAATPDLLGSYKGDYFNCYGPTETAICVSIFQAKGGELNPGIVPLGRPIPNVQVYIVDENMALVPVGVAGEICVGGAGLARGYLNNPELTAGKFTTEHKIEGAGRIYKTGDLGRWLSDGIIEFIGRKDQQVKIRGYRIELEEVESVLQRSPGVKAAAAAVHADVNGSKRLVGYVVTEEGFDRVEVNAFLKAHLPEYMVPGFLMELEALPLTSNDKIDRKALPVPDRSQMSSPQYEAPRNELEQALVSIWQELLAVERVGIHDNFFELGGDSIISIQLVSRARRKGYSFAPRDLFLHQSVAALAAALAGRTQTSHAAEQELLTGGSGLLPIQQWYFESNPAEASHFNQSILLGLHKSIGEELLQSALTELMQHHDALRFTYTQTASGWTQEYGSHSAQLEVVDLAGAAEEELPSLIEQHAALYQRSLNIEAGDLVRMVLVKTPSSQSHNRLLIIIHHLAVDGVSWRILLEDLEQLLDGSSALERKTSSYRQWHEVLQQYGQGKALQAQRSYWQSIGSNYSPLPSDNPVEGTVLTADLKHYAVALETDLTSALLQQVGQVYRTEINDLLLGALCKTLTRWSGEQQVVIGLEGHGREHISNDIDTSRTVGWFTNLYPVLLQCDRQMKEGDLIKSVKEQMRRIPDKGLGYGVLKYMNGEDELQGRQWDVVFNYLGQLDNVVSNSKWFTAAEEPVGNPQGGANTAGFLLGINSMVQGGRLVLSWSYSSRHYEESTIESLAAQYLSDLGSLITHCREHGGQEHTPSDFGLTQELGYAELDAFMEEEVDGRPRREQVETICRLSGLQQAMLFHSLYDEQDGSYIAQISCDMVSPDIDAFRKSWKVVLENHSILRTAFYADRFNIPVQCVYRSVDLPIHMVDFRESERADQLLQEYLHADQFRSFRFSSAPLMRISLVQLSDTRYRMVWTFHHIVGDGWSQQVIMEEFLTAYESFASGKGAPSLRQERYEDYIRYIERQDKFAGEEYWRRYMKGIETGSLLPFIASSSKRNKSVEPYYAHELKIDHARTSLLQSYAQKQRITVNTVIQGVWSFLLHSYTNSQDICFGTMVSGRPAELPAIEQRVGMYINTLPVRSTLNREQAVAEWLQAMQQDQLESREYQHTSLNDIQRWTGVQGDLFDSLLTFQNYPVSEVVAAREWQLKAEDVELREHTSNYPLTIRTRLEAETLVQFVYKSSILEEAYVRMISSHFEHVLLQVIGETAMVTGDISLLSSAEKKQMLHGFNDTSIGYPLDKTIVSLFEEQVDKTPGAIAATLGAEHMSYAELEEKANRLAHCLLSKGIGANALVGLCLDRSLDMIVSIVGVLKAGAAYVPIDPNYPADRISYMTADSGCSLLVTTSGHEHLVRSAAEVLCLDRDAPVMESLPAARPVVDLDTSAAAYVIYTSGSTGLPKGVVVEHRNVVRLFRTEKPLFDFDSNDVWSLFHSFCFDFSVWEMYGALLHGGRVVIVPGETARDVEQFAALLVREKVTVLSQTPGAFYALQEHMLNHVQEAPSLRYVIFGGEALNPSKLKTWLPRYPRCGMINMYGITETTVHVTYRQITEEDAQSPVSNIGRPIPTLQCYVLDADRQLQPVGVPGELYVGGAGVARGYLNRQSLTEERFIPDIFRKEGRLYRSGDLARWLPDGTLEYLGRADDQVKIRGYRIELGEVETALQKAPGIKQAVVLVRDDNGNKRLVAYVVKEEGFDKDAVMNFVGGLLPDYMTPSLLVEVESIPLTSNGKVDRKKLRETVVLPVAQSYEEAVTPLQETLVSIWQELLGVERVGIHDNFFELGGDSIITIQVVSRAKRKGYSFSPKDVFVHQTIAALSEALSGQAATASKAEQGVLTGASGLLPIQQWYFESNPAEASHFNQSVLLGLHKSIGEEQLQSALAQLMQHHDALRFTYTQTASGWTQEYGSHSAQLEVVDLAGVNEDELPSLIEQHAALYQRSLNIEAGDLVRMVLVKTPSSQSHNRLLIIIHHLAVDGVSWRILLEDLEQLLDSNSALERKTSSYRQWHEALQQYGQGKALQAQRSYWQAIGSNYHPLPSDRGSNEPVLIKDIHSHIVSLDAARTRSLLQEVPAAYRTEINDLLLSALARTLCAYSGHTKLVIGLEGHGREHISNDIDTSRTVGWFTSLYPVLLECAEDMADGDVIKSVKEQMRRIPDKGLGYGVLKYMNGEEELQGRQWDVVFNYLGQLDNVVSKNKWLAEAHESGGSDVSESNRAGHNISINSMVQGGELILSWSYSSRHFDAATIKALADQYIANLAMLIGHCRTQEEPAPTPSDYGLANEVSYAELDTFLDGRVNGEVLRNRVESIYRLSALQEGMLFHSLYNEQEGSYIEQFSCDLLNLDTAAFTRSWNLILEQHSIMRTGFFVDAFNIPVQVVYKNVKMPVRILDYTSLDEADQQKAVLAYEQADRIQPFDFKQAPMMRISLLRLGDERYRMLWTYHHIVFDGWSKPVLMQEFLANYDLLASGKEVPAVTEDRFEDYIRYIERRGKSSEEEYWKGYMGGMEQGSLLPFIPASVERNKNVDTYRAVELRLDNTQTGLLEAYAQQQHTTVNTIVQAVWSFLMHRYTGNKDVCFGLTVSGRPEDLTGVEHRIGMYINTIPLHSVLDREQLFADWLTAIQKDQSRSREYQYSSVNDIQRWIGIQGDLFDTMITFQNYPVSEVIESNEWKLQALFNGMHEQTSNYPLSIRVMLSADTLVQFIYKGILDEAYVKMMAEHFHQVMLQVIGGKVVRVGDLQLLSLPEQEKLQQLGRGQEAAPSSANTFIDLFQQQVLQSPEAVALDFEGATLSYRQLDERSNQLAQYLRKAGVHGEELIPICLHRSPEMIIAMLAVLKAGAAYVPVDPSYPQERISYMLEDTASRLVLSSSVCEDRLPSRAGLILLDEQEEMINWCSTEPVSSDIAPHHLAYVIYTSGSSGRPKGVLVEHGGLLASTRARNSYYGDIASALLVPSFSFDSSVAVIFGSLASGTRLCLCRDEFIKDPAYLKGALKEVTMILCVPSYYRFLVDEGLVEQSSLTTVILAGEKLEASLANRHYDVLPHAALYNEYGPTENTVWATVSRVEAGEQSVSIGGPVSGVQLYILDASGEPVPFGVAGELCIGGGQLARGYLNQEELTAQKFISDPQRGRLYKTGDRVRWNLEGKLEFLGRMDDQVKIRGYRIELGEIEEVLAQAPGVRQAVVLVHEEEENKRLVSYAVGGEDFDRDAALAYLKDKLPEYMVPGILVQVQEIPLTPNGKVDKKKLLEALLSTSSSTSYAAPRNPLEESLARIWSELLDAPNVGIHDDFFALGGHSLLAIRVLSAIRHELGIEVTIREIFEYPTIAQLSAQMPVSVSNELLPSISKLPRPELIPLSFAQERLWFVDRLQGSVQYHMPWVLRLSGALDVDLLEDSLRAVVDRHEALRSVIKEVDGIGYQHVTGPDNWSLKYTSEEEIMATHGSVQAYIQELIKTPYNLSADPMLRVTLIRLSDREHLLAGIVHHIAFDAWSTSILVRELAEFYRSKKEGREAVLPELPVQYADYSIWQRRYLSGEVFESKLSYWKRQLGGVEPLALPTDYIRPPEQSMKGGAVSALIDKEMHERLLKTANREGVTLFMLMLTAFKALLHRYTGQTDICVGASVARRQQKEVEGLIGFFVNTLAFRSEVSPGAAFRELLQQVRITVLDAFDHQDVPFEKVVEVLGLERDPSRNPVFQVMFVMENTPEAGALELGDVQLSGEGTGMLITKFDLTLAISPAGEGLRMDIMYRTTLYREETISLMLGYYTNILKTIVQDVNEGVGQLSLLSRTEQQQLMSSLTEKTVAYPNDKTVMDLFEEQAALAPDSVALAFREERLTYRELDERSNQLAHYLKGKGVRKGHLVPLYMERSLEVIVGMLGIMKAGAAYVPVDTGYPADRVRYMLMDLSPSVILTGPVQGEHIENIIYGHEKLGDIPVVDIEESSYIIASQPKGNPGSGAGPRDLAYLIYTSGSTGKPKGVMIEHRSLVDYVYGLENSTRVKECRTFGLVSTLSADLGNTVIYSALLTGGELHVLSQAAMNDAGLILDYFRTNRIDCLKIVPSHWKALCMDDELLLPARLLIFGGEALQSSVVETIRSSGASCRIVNHYGPTETTIGKLLHEVNPATQYGYHIPIGRPFSNTRIYIVDKSLRACAIGVAGEILIGGDGLARGYLNRPDLDEEKFIPSPFRQNEKLYRTGDLARWLPDGNIEFQGRVDDQVKIRGYRIELGEIERVLRDTTGVRQAVVIVREEQGGDKQLAAFVVADGGYSKETVLSHLRTRLPAYMVPPLLTEVEEIPLTANGKIDRKKLLEKLVQPASSGPYAGPRTPLEEVLVTLWQDLLGVEQVGIHDNFFELGGDSIITIQVVSRARRLGHELQVVDLFEHQTIAGLSRSLAERGKSEASTAEQGTLTGPSGLLPIQHWYLDSDPANISHFNQAVLLSIDKSINDHQVQGAIEQLMRHHDALRFIYQRQVHGWTQEYGTQVTNVEVLSLNDVKDDELPAAIEQHGHHYQRSLNIEKGDLVRVVLMQTATSQPRNRLLIVIHHLAVDGVSWRILLEDLEMVLHGIKFNAPVTLGTKTNSYREWYNTLAQYGESNALQAQKPYWEKIVRSYRELPSNKAYHGAVTTREIRHCMVALDAANTRTLLQEIPKTYHTEINDILLAALAKTICEFAQEDKVVIGMEGHGREALAEGMDTSRTVGWFTNKYPVLLEYTAGMTPGDLVKSIKEQLRLVPDKGMGYGVLKYIVAEDSLKGKPCWDIVFNYLGQLDNVVSGGKLLSPAGESTGLQISEENLAGYTISINSMVQGGELILGWSYSTRHYEAETINALAESYLAGLKAIILHCKDQQGAVFTPSDYGLSGDISYSELDKFLSKENDAEADDIMVF
jgi:amino acid adenylation domain-containing protein/non-ribosomal peptide synthase protein (TIGR01720 family)